MNANIEIIFHDFLKINFLDLRGLWFRRQCGVHFNNLLINYTSKAEKV